METYKCSICKKEYNEPVKMAECIIKCNEVRKREDVQKKRQELITQENKRIAEIQEAFDGFCKLFKNYQDDYKKLPIFKGSTLFTSSPLLHIPNFFRF